MPELDIVVTHPSGLHARPASQFVRLAKKFPCNITVHNQNNLDQTVNAKNILGVLTLGVEQGNIIHIKTDGEKSEEALLSLKKLIETDFKGEIS